MTDIFVLDGNGILSGTHDWDEVGRRNEEDRRNAEAAAELELRRQEILSGIERLLEPELGECIAEEVASRKLSDETLRSHRVSFAKFREHCGRYGPPLSPLPAEPQIVAGFLASESGRGVAHLNKLKAAISHAHWLAGLPSPCDDVLVGAVIRFAKKFPIPTTDESSQHN